MLRLGELLRRSSHRIERPLIVFAGTVDGTHDSLIALDQYRGVHSGLEVERADGVVSSRFAQQPSFPLEPLPQLRVGKRVEQSNHRQGNRALANEIDLPLENICRIVVKAENKAGHDFHAITLK